MQNKKMLGSLMLSLTAVIWGTAFVAQSVGMDYLGPFTFNAVRFLIGGIILSPYYFWQKRKNPQFIGGKKDKRFLLLGGLICGVLMAVASSFQQFGLMYTTVGKAGFLTALYIVIVPVASVFFRKKVAPWVWVAVATAVVGTYFLCIGEGFTFGFGDMLVLICAFCFSAHIMVVDYLAPKTDGVLLSCLQFLISGGICAVFMFILERPSFSLVLQAWQPVLYAGVMSCGVAYTLQILGQKHVAPTIASLILSFESVVSVLAGWALLGQKLTAREWLGCLLVFVAIILAQIPQPKAQMEIQEKTAL